MDKTKTIGICLAGIVIAVIAMVFFKVPISIICIAAILLACPLLHLWMNSGEHGRTMKDGNHKH